MSLFGLKQGSVLFEQPQIEFIFKRLFVLDIKEIASFSSFIFYLKNNL